MVWNALGLDAQESIDNHIDFGSISNLDFSIEEGHNISVFIRNIKTVLSSESYCGIRIRGDKIVYLYNSFVKYISSLGFRTGETGETGETLEVGEIKNISLESLESTIKEIKRNNCNIKDIFIVIKDSAITLIYTFENPIGNLTKQNKESLDKITG